MRKKFRLKSFLFISLIFLVFLVGCSGKVTKGDTVEITPSKLFQGEAKRLEPHLGLISGCVDVSYKGDKDTIALKYEIWKDGKLEKNQEIMCNTIDEPINNSKEKEFNGEITISLSRGNLEENNEMKVVTAINSNVEKSSDNVFNNYTASTFYIEGFPEDYSWMYNELHDKIVEKNKDEILIWSVTASDDKNVSYENNMDNNIKNSSWAFALKVCFR